jgi:hypothetical protein
MYGYVYIHLKMYIYISMYIVVIARDRFLARVHILCIYISDICTIDDERGQTRRVRPPDNRPVFPELSFIFGLCIQSNEQEYERPSNRRRKRWNNDVYDEDIESRDLMVSSV